jgi:hypothetical protein
MVPESAIDSERAPPHELRPMTMPVSEAKDRLSELSQRLEALGRYL